jgi:dTDP-4-amino-4,6-dideoxygalactose transaminase
MNITVTKPFLPPIEDYQRYLKEIWTRGWLTNNGPLVNELELRLKQYLNIEHLLYVVNGTIALQVAIKALGLTGQVITTPFSYVATTSSLIWEGCEPVMVDVLQDTLNIDPSRIEAAITKRTTGILATHVYGNACEIDTIEKIAKRHGLKVIYDGAHAFASAYHGRSLLSYGDVCTTSFHATKLFHTVEGGMVCTREPELLRKMSLLRNFGHTSPTDFECPGINGKSSEFHAAMGLCNLPHVAEILRLRQELSEHYTAQLRAVPVQRPKVTAGCDYNHAYYPVIFESEAVLTKVAAALTSHHIFPRRYFYPSLSQLPYLKKRFETPISDDISPRILCLPLYHSLTKEEIDMICRLINRTVRYT